jgi:hypothetical protein
MHNERDEVNEAGWSEVTWHIWERREVRLKFWPELEDLKYKAYMEE